MACDPRPAVVLIPALDEEAAIGTVLREIPRARIREVVVVDNGSTDRTAERARAAGAVVVSEPRRGYGRACLAGLRYLESQDPPPRAVVFGDGDGGDRWVDLPRLLDPVLGGTHDLVLGSRIRGAEPGALLPQQIAGNAIATGLIRLLTGVSYSDLGPLRVVSWPALRRLEMSDPTYGWTVEMQLKAARAGFKVMEIPVGYGRRLAGRSKVAGSIEGSVRAGGKILATIARHAFWRAGC